MRYISKSEKETYNFAKKYSKSLKGGEVIGLIGDLGAGKTVFAKGLAYGLGIKRNINSPTFVLMKVYPANLNRIKQLCHIDAYRLKLKEDLMNIGSDDYLGQKDTVTIIEWADRVKGIYKNIKYFKFNILNNNKRVINY